MPAHDGGVLRVAHLSSFDYPFEPRIFLKECRSLAAHGYDVRLLVPHSARERRDGVTIVPLPSARNRLERLLIAAPRAALWAWRERPALYHVHDVMILPWALLLRLLTGRPVVYDVHEDNTTGIRAKPYLPGWTRRLVAGAVDRLERFAAGFLEIVIAERYYAQRFPRATPVLNYPAEETLAELLAIPPATPAPGSATNDPVRLLYTGTTSELRGALVMARLARALPPASLVRVVGRCDPALARAMRAIEPDASRLEIIGVGEHLPFERIVACYREPWTAALALFVRDPHVVQKEPTKLFEYMAAGLPILASDFPVWRALIEDAGLGICVPVEDDAAVVAAAQALHADIARRGTMGRRGREAARTRYRWSSQEAELLGLYARCLPRPTTMSEESRLTIEDRACS